MKNLITSVASIIVLLVFLLQFTVNQVTYNKVMLVDKSVNAFKEVAKQEGMITDDNMENLKEQVSHDINCSTEKVEVSGTRAIKIRGDIIYYHVKVPINNIFAATGFWGINEAENTSNYIVKGHTTSEFLNKE